MRIAHLSDLHVLDLTGVRWTRFLNKRVTGLVSLAAARKDAHPIAIAERLVQALLADPVDHVVVTGDLSNLSLESEFAAARRILEPLGGYERLSVIPGNHDVYTRGAQRSRRFEQVFGDWMWRETAGSDTTGERPPGPPGDYPFVKRLGPVTLIGFGSAVARLPVIATGVVAQAQLERLRGLAPSLAGTFPIGLVHHNLHPRGWRKDAMHGLTNRADLLRTASEAGVKLLLHGHTHVAHRFVEHGMDIIGSGSSTWRSEHPGHTARYNIYHIDDGRLARVEVRRYDLATDAFSEAAS